MFYLAAFLALLIPKLSSETGQQLAPYPLENSEHSAFPAHLYYTRQEPYRSYECFPKRIHLAQANNVQDDHRVSMTVSFSLDYENCRGAQPTVFYGRSFRYEGTVKAQEPKQFNYTSGKSDGLFQSDWIFHVELPRLKAGGFEQYWYRIVVDGNPSKAVLTGRRLHALRGMQKRLGETKPHPFRTPPLPGAPTTLALVGDLGQTENSTRTMAHIWRATQKNDFNDHPISQLLIAGDMAYADSDPWRWPSFLDVMEPLFRSTPLHVAAGNHEIECDSITREIFVPYENYFRNPNRIQEADKLPVSDDYRKTLWRGSCSAPSEFQSHYDYGNAFYSYDHGLVKIIVLSSYSNTTAGSVQYQWLEGELQSVDRKRTPWLLVSFHSPLYTTFLGHVNEAQSIAMKKAMEPLFVQYSVNLVVSGHDHAYMRTHPLAYGQVDPSAPIYLTLGAGGNREQHSEGYRHENPEEWVAARTLNDYGYGHLYIPNATHAMFNWVRDGVSKDGIRDHVWISNTHFKP